MKPYVYNYNNLEKSWIEQLIKSNNNLNEIYLVKLYFGPQCIMFGLILSKFLVHPTMANVSCMRYLIQKLRHRINKSFQHKVLAVAVWYIRRHC